MSEFSEFAQTLATYFRNDSSPEQFTRTLFENIYENSNSDSLLADMENRTLRSYFYGQNNITRIARKIYGNLILENFEYYIEKFNNKLSLDSIYALNRKFDESCSDTGSINGSKIAQRFQIIIENAASTNRKTTLIPTKSDSYDDFQRLVNSDYSEEDRSTEPESLNTISPNKSYFGYIETNCELIVRDGHGLSPNNIKFMMNSSEIPLYEKIKNTNSDIKTSVQNNDMISVTKVETSVTDNDERVVVNCIYKLIKYDLFDKTLKLWDERVLYLDNNLSDYVSSFNVFDNTYDVPNAMGMAFFVITQDKKLLFSQRSLNRGIRPGEIDSTIVEGLKPQGEEYDITSHDFLINEIKRGYMEEVINDELSEEDIKIAGIAFDRDYGQWNFVGTIYSNWTAEEIKSMHATRKDLYERTTIIPISLVDSNGNKSLKELKKFLFNNIMKSKPWGMMFANLKLTLLAYGFTERDIMLMTKDIES